MFTLGTLLYKKICPHGNLENGKCEEKFVIQERAVSFNAVLTWTVSIATACFYGSDLSFVASKAFLYLSL